MEQKNKRQKVKVAAYCRVSTDKEDQLASLAAQKGFFEEYIKLHQYELVQLYADEGISGTKLKNRSAFNQMMADARDGQFERVFVKDISRFARNAVDFLQSIRELKAIGIQCDFVNASLSTEDGEFTLGILALVAQEESANLSKRVKFGKAKNARQGKVPNLVYGYDKKVGELFTLQINEKEAEVVKRIYRMYVEEGYGANKIAQILNGEGKRTKRDCLFTQNAVTRILKNPLYMGKVVNGKEEVQDFLTGVRVKTCPERWIVKDNPALAVIPAELYQKVQEIMGRRKCLFSSKNKRGTERYPFSTLLTCAECGYSFRRIHKSFVSKEYIKWECSGRNANGIDFCKNHIKIEERVLLSAIAQYLLSSIENKEKLLSDTKKAIRQKYKKNTMAMDKKQLEMELAKLKKVKRKQITLFEADVITLEELRQRIEDCNQKIQNCQERLLSCQNDSAEPDCLIEKYCKNCTALISSAVCRNHFLHQMIEQILVLSTGEIQIYLKEFKAL